MEYKRVHNMFFKCTRGNNGHAEFLLVKGKPIIIPGYEKYEFFCFHDGLQVVGEATTGMFIAEARSTKDAIAKAADRLHNYPFPDGWNFERVIEENIRKYGLSPRYAIEEKEQ